MLSIDLLANQNQASADDVSSPASDCAGVGREREVSYLLK